MRALGKITPGKLLGLEVHVAAIQAEEDLREIAAFNTSFGGEQAKRHVEWLKDRLDEYARLTTGESADADRFASAEEMAAFFARVNQNQKIVMPPGVVDPRGPHVGR